MLRFVFVAKYCGHFAHNLCVIGTVHRGGKIRRSAFQGYPLTVAANRLDESICTFGHEIHVALHPVIALLQDSRVAILLIQLPRSDDSHISPAITAVCPPSP